MAEVNQNQPLSYSNHSIEKLRGSENYQTWKYQIRMLLTLDGLWETVEGTDVDPSHVKRALARIGLSVSTACLQHIRKATTAKEAWDNLKTVFENKGLYRRVLLLRQLHRIEYKQYNCMSRYLEAVMSLVHQLADIDKNIEDKEVVELLLSGLPDEYDALVSNLETANIADTNLTADMVRSRLLQEESRKMEGSSCVDEAALFSKARNTVPRQQKQVTCHYCGKSGHIKSKCFKYRKDKVKNRSLLATESSKAFFVKKSSFYLDSGCSNHLCNDKTILKDYKELPGEGSKVTLANDDSISAEGVGELPVGGVIDKLNKETSGAKCETCLLGKQVALPYPVGEATRAHVPLQLVHSDVAGPFQEDSIGGARFMVTMTDDYTRKSHIFLMRHKSEVIKHFITYKNLVEKQLGLPIKTLRTDFGSEYCNKSFADFLRREGIVHQKSVPYCHQQCGVAERLNRTLLDKARCMLYEAGLSKCFWGEAVMTAAYLKNRSPTSALSGLDVRAAAARRRHKESARRRRRR
ncbi:uncharacterized protein LOC134789592 [Cydia splendana]|uniref:uncharacterized protein LOC134789592 n=1 Tax=Cydia splendana TaxID=1100963 RepID=UPI00300C65F4